MDIARDEARGVRHIGEKNRTHGVGDRTEATEVDRAWIGRTAAGDQLRSMAGSSVRARRRGLLLTRRRAELRHDLGFW